VEDIESIQRYIPRSNTRCGAIIITTQRPNFQPITDTFRKIALASLNSTDSSTLLFKYLDREEFPSTEETSKAFEIVDVVGGLPLAITTISGSIYMSNSTIAEFLEHLKRSDKIWDKTESTRVQGYNKSLGSVFEFALSKLTDTSRRLIHLLAFLSPDSIPEAMFLEKPEDPNLEFLSNVDE
jgi:hypothetical protein